MTKRWIVLALLLAGLLPPARAQQTDTAATDILSQAGQGQYNLQKKETGSSSTGWCPSRPSAG